MTCEEIQSKTFYLAEDDPEIRKIVHEHIDSCSVCDTAYSQYRALLNLYRSDRTDDASPLSRGRWGAACPEHSNPPLTPPLIRGVNHGLNPNVWRLMRIAAVLILGLLLGVHWRSQRVAPERPEALQWSQPALHIPVTYSDSTDREFQARVESVEDSLARLKTQTLNNQF